MAKMFSVDKRIFFDKPGIISRMTRKTRRVLSATGAYARGVMKKGMRYRKATSQPGDYPSAHKGNPLLRQLIFFGADIATGSVVIGPILFKPSGEAKTIPQLINEGGTVVRPRKFVVKGRQPKRIEGKATLTYQPRPFVELTLPIAAGRLVTNMEKISF